MFCFLLPGNVDPPAGSNGCNERKSVSVEANSVQMNCAEEVTCVTRFQRHLADYLFANGYPKAALNLARDRPELNELCLTELFEEAVQIEDALYRGDTGPAHNWLQEANFKLKRTEVS